MSRFAAVLRRVSDGLDLPQPTKSRILLEMGADLEDAYRHHRGQGLSEEEAVRRAEESFAVSDEALKHLARIHLAGGQFADRLISQLGSLWAKILLVLWVLVVVLIASRVATTERFFLLVSPFVWPILVLAVLSLALSPGAAPAQESDWVARSDANSALLMEVFAKFANAVIGHGAPIVLPSVDDAIDYEAELAFVIGTTARNVPREQAMQHVLGYMPFHDVSARTWQTRTSQWTMGKTMDTFAPMGPALVTKDEVAEHARATAKRVTPGGLMEVAQALAERLHQIPPGYDLLEKQIEMFRDNVERLLMRQLPNAEELTDIAEGD